VGTEGNDVRELVHEKRAGLLTEFWLFVTHNKKWWLVPILLIILALGALVLLAGSGAAPFIYTLF
jgi:hypothetical protein